MRLLLLYNHQRSEQANILLAVIQKQFIDKDKPELFILNNASNNNKTLGELSQTMSFNPNKQLSWYTQHIINLAVETVLFGNHQTSLINKF